MLKPRLVGVVVVRDGLAVQSLGFSRWLPVGRPEVAVEFLNAWGIDEIALLDISAGPAGRGPDLALVERAAARCFVPLAVGGGVRDLAAMRALVRSGADKVVVNTAATENPALVQEGAAVFGRQCMVVSMDVRALPGGRREVFAAGGRRPTGLDPVDWARRAESLGAGEILLNSIDRDGSRRGYDIPLIRYVAAAVGIPLIACGGVGRPEHLAPAFTEGGAAAAAAANFWHFTEHSVNVAKARLRRDGIAIRGDLYADYAGANQDADGRVAKRDEGYLEALRFEIHPPESI